MDNFRRKLARLFDPFWVIPALACLAAFVAGVAAPRLDQELSQYVPFLFPGGTDGARTMLSTIAGAMISLTGLVFSITIVVLQLASSQFSPRVLHTFLDERVPQVTLGVFAASFIYSLTVLRSVKGTVDGAQTSVPQIAITLSFVLVLTSVAMFLAFIHHITQAISVEVIVQTVGEETRQLLEDSRVESRMGEQKQVESDEGGSRSATARNIVVLTGSNGYLNYTDAPTLVEVAAEHAARIEMLHPLGTFLVIDQPLALLHPVGAARQSHPLADCQDEVRAAVSITTRRTMEQDVTFGLRQLVDIAERALSPGINDPTTAVQVLNELHTILRLVAVEPARPTTQCGPDGVVRLRTCEWTFEHYLDVCIDEIAHWGESSLQVPSRITDMLTQLSTVAQPEYRTCLAEKAAVIRKAALAGRQ